MKENTRRELLKQELPPVGVCTSCGKFTYDAGLINERCSVGYGRQRCSGVFWSASSERGDWEKCRHCDGTGVEHGVQCPSCQGTGWGYIRDGRIY